MTSSPGPRPTMYGDRQALEDAFARLDLWQRIKSGQLREVVAADWGAGYPPGGRQQILKHYDGVRHVATTHRVVDAQGKPTHWDEKDCLLPDGTKLARRG